MVQVWKLLRLASGKLYVGVILLVTVRMASPGNDNQLPFVDSCLHSMRYNFAIVSTHNLRITTSETPRVQIKLPAYFKCWQRKYDGLKVHHSGSIPNTTTVSKIKKAKIEKTK
jgi:hypothetical protein